MCVCRASFLSQGFILGVAACSSLGVFFSLLLLLGLPEASCFWEDIKRLAIRLKHKFKL